MGRVLRRWAWLIVVFAVIAGITAAVVSYELPKEYEATTVALVNPKQAPLGPGDTSGGVYVTADQLDATYAKLISATPVYQKLIAAGIPRTEDQLAGEITAKTDTITTLIDITVKDPDPAVTQSIAQNVVPAFNASLQELQSRVATPASRTQRLDTLVPWQVPSRPPTTPVSPKPLLNVLIALAAGIGLGVGFAFLLEYLDNTVKSEMDVRLRLDQTLLGPVIYKPTKKRPSVQHATQEEVALVTVTQPKEPVSEAYRAIRTNLLFTATDKPLRTLVVTSAIPGEGKTSTACNLAVVMAQAGNRVVLVDADFRRPELHKVFHKSNVGLGNLILGDLAEEDLVLKTQVPNLSVVCSGPTPPNPSELLGSIRMQGVMDRLRQIADVVIFDTPPVGVVTDATVLAARVDGVVLVVERGRTDVHNIQRAIDKLTAVRANLLGVILNKVKVSQASEYDYYRYYTEPPRAQRASNGGNNGAGNGKDAKQEVLASAQVTRAAPATPVAPVAQPFPAESPPTVPTPSTRVATPERAAEAQISPQGLTWRSLQSQPGPEPGGPVAEADAPGTIGEVLRGPDGG